MTVLITLTTAGADTGPFDLYSNLDGYVSAFETGVSKSSLLAGYSSALVPDGTSVIRIKSNGNCVNYIDVNRSDRKCYFLPVSGSTQKISLSELKGEDWPGCESGCIDNGDETLLDQCSGLMWIKNGTSEEQTYGSIPEQSSDFSLTEGTSDWAGDLELVDNDYSTFNSTEGGLFVGTYSFDNLAHSVQIDGVTGKVYVETPSSINKARRRERLKIAGIVLAVIAVILLIAYLAGAFG